jgi:TonB family protein
VRERLHQEIESIAGAIALGEATDADRHKYREHIASCTDCLNELGGEHEIARTAAAIGAARDGEVWEPQLSNAFERRARRPSQVLRFAAAFVVTFAGAAAALHYLAVPSAVPVAMPASTTAVAGAVAKPAGAQVPAPLPQNQRRFVVYHNVVQIARNPVALPKSPEIAAVTVYPRTAPASKHPSKVSGTNDPVWRTVSRMTTTALTETAPQRVSNAESLQLGSAFRATTNEAVPIGGETAINPQPPMIAYAEGAEGTTVFEVLIDERGLPTKCVITKPAGYRFLDDAVCKAAMKARFSPKTIDGRAVPGVYRDAFTFRVSSDATVGLPKPIH